MRPMPRCLPGLPGPARSGAAVMRRWFDLMLENADDLAALMTAEQGKPLAEARGEVMYGASFIEWFAEEAKRVCGDVLSSTWSDEAHAGRQATDWCLRFDHALEFPDRDDHAQGGSGRCGRVARSLSSPAEQTPLSALALAELAHRAGLPPGVINIVTADANRSVEIGKVLCSSRSYATCRSRDRHRSGAS